VAAAVAVTLLLWASAFVAIRFAGRQIGPGELALGRLAVGSAALGALMVVRHESLPRGRALGFSVVCGLLWFGVYNVALNAAERHLDAGTASLLVNVGPIFIALLAGGVLGEGLPRSLLGGCLVAFSGVAVIAAAVSSHGPSATWDAALCLLAAATYAIGVIAQKPALRSASALSVTWTACTVGALVCLPWAPGLVSDVGAARMSGVAWTVYLGVGPTAIGFACWAYALARSSAGRLGVSTYLVPPLAVLLGWALLSETPPLLALPGGLLCLAGVAMSRRRPRGSVEAAGGTARPPAAVSATAPATSALPRS
jgi:drug/metabolite transporter (DMT)-like permease